MPHISQAGSRAVGFEVGAVDHGLVRHTGLGRQGRDNPLEHVHAAPPHETVVERLVRSLTGRRIPPLQDVADYVDDAANYPAIVDPTRAASAGSAAGVGASGQRAALAMQAPNSSRNAFEPRQARAIKGSEPTSCYDRFRTSS